MNKYYSGFYSFKRINRLYRMIRSRFYLNANHDPANSIFVAGNGRSGTTWLAQIIEAYIPSRLMFEPFYFENKNPGFNTYQYLRPDDEHEKLYTYTEKVVTGRIRDQWIDWHNKSIFAKYRVIKAIRANMFLRWLQVKFPEVPQLFIIRHPCAVVLSRKELKWATDTDIDLSLQQERLVEDHLSDKVDLIYRAQTDEEKHAIIWSIANLIPLRQFIPGKFNLIFYEDLVIDPESELKRIFKFLGFDLPTYNMKKVSQLKGTSSVNSAVITGEDKISRWKNRLTAVEVDRILNIVEEFGLGNLYRDSVTPIMRNENNTSQKVTETTL